jgi:hypothetical protein
LLYTGDYTHNAVLSATIVVIKRLRSSTLNRILSTTKKTRDNDAERDQHEYSVYERSARSTDCNIIEIFPTIHDRQDHQDHAPEPFPLLRPSLEAGVNEWHVDWIVAEPTALN